MKKILLLLLVAPVIGFGQVLTDILYYEVEQQIPAIRVNPSGNYNYFINGEVKSSRTENPNDYNFFTVPEGKLWQIKNYEYGNVKNLNDYSNYNRLGFPNDVWYKQVYSNSEEFDILFINDDNFTNNSIYSVHPNSHTFDIYRMHSRFNSNLYLKSGTKFTFDVNYFRVVIYEYTFDNNSLSYNEPETIKNNSNTPVLFPNPTSSLLALNSDKEYDIEVYDMAGNKVMALTGNTIDMSHLSSATYIVKALDKVDNEEVSYKVVKN